MATAASQARDVAAQLAERLRPWLQAQRSHESFRADEFLRRIAEREGVGIDAAERHARVVFRRARALRG